MRPEYKDDYSYVVLRLRMCGSAPRLLHTPFWYCAESAKHRYGLAPTWSRKTHWVVRWWTSRGGVAWGDMNAEHLVVMIMVVIIWHLRFPQRDLWRVFVLWNVTPCSPVEFYRPLMEHIALPLIITK
jgi:hypothetical protein